jgi:hypothetical protein
MTTLAEALSTLDGKAALTAEDALAVRRIIYGQSLTVDQAEADALFKLNADAGALTPEWCALFIEVMTDYVVRQQDPEGYVDDAKADWLMGAIASAGRVRGDEVEMLVHMLEEADQVPDKLSAFALSAVKAATLSRLRRTGAVSALDIDRLRRLVFAKGGEANVAVTRREAEALFDINDAKRNAPANPAWTDFFVRAVANAVLFEPVWAPDRGAELEREAEVADTGIHPFGRILASLHDLSGSKAIFLETLHEFTDHKPSNWDFSRHDMDALRERYAADEACEAQAEAVTADEAHWLADRINRDGRLDPSEQALLAFLRANARKVDPSLEPLLSRASAA